MMKLRKQIMILGDMKLLMVRLLSWSEYLNKLRMLDNKDWITVLKVAIDLYNGKIRGFASLPCT